ncbi:MAG: RNB domain-containing ribonuclease, partial [Fibrobacterales bacterium]
PEVSDLPEAERLALTHLEAYAIDDEDNKDPDDAISYDDGTLWIHIADVASIVQPNSALDVLAKDNAANLYLPETTVTMLPERITEIYGLGLSEYSPALSFALTLKESGEIDTVQIHPSTIKVTRTTYRKTEEVIDQSPFKEMYALAQKYQNYRIQNNAVMISFPEVKVRVKNDTVHLIDIPHLKAQELVTNAMVMTGECAARYAQENNIPFLYATQPATDMTEVPEELHNPKTLSEMFAFRRFLKPGQMKASAEPHASLGLTVYSRATSPIRRYVDLIAHQQIRAHVTGQTLMDEQEMLNRVGAYEASIGSIVKLERLSNRHWTLVYLMQNPNWQGNAIVVSKKERFYIMIVPELGIESRITLQQDVELDTKITVSVTSINLPQLEIYFQVVG